MDPLVIRIVPWMALLLRLKNQVAVIFSKLKFFIHILISIVTFYSLMVNISLINILSWAIITLPLIFDIKHKISTVKPWGRIIDSKTGEPVIEVAVKLYKQDSPNDIYSIVTTDKLGRYVFSPENGSYILKVYKIDQLLATHQVEATNQHPNINLVIKLTR
jgi:hypothetical protein